MKFEVEIPDEDIINAVRYHVEKLTSGNNYRLLNLIDEQVTHTIMGTDFGPAISNAIKARAEIEIAKACEKKVPGWVQRQMKEMLKYVGIAYFKNTQNSED